MHYRHPQNQVSNRHLHPRRAFVLVLVMTVIVMISLAGFSFVATMRAEHKAVYLRGTEMQLENAIASGLERVKIVLELPRSDRFTAGGFYDNPQLFRAVLVRENKSSFERCRFTLGSPKILERRTVGIRYGLIDESAKLHLGEIAEWEKLLPGTGKKAIMQLPGMKEEIADAILDWMDEDSQRRPLGAEAEDYLQLENPYSPRNAVPVCLEELLLVKGVTRSLLFGTDYNRNFRIDENERRITKNDSQSPDEEQRPWCDYLTLYSAERNESFSGEPRIDLNQKDLAVLYENLSEILTEPQAQFIAAYRKFGPYKGNEVGSQKQEAQFVPSGEGKFKIASVFDLYDVRVQVGKTKKKKPIVLESPFQAASGSLGEELSELREKTTVIPAKSLRGRINLNLAPVEVLRAIPGMTEELADQIVSGRAQPDLQDDEKYRDSTWILSDGLVTLAQMRALDPFLTTHGDVFRAQIIGHFDNSEMVQRVETVIDATHNPARTIYWKDMKVLGRGFSREQLRSQSAMSERSEETLRSRSGKSIR